mmetsp:Transcript_14752/g.27736  ORF Transcript_14752/g.27736 Transcript_14752/m.27736 type:complete len:408 (+) Transcript_14752:132-1355(+)
MNLSLEPFFFGKAATLRSTKNKGISTFECFTMNVHKPYILLTCFVCLVCTSWCFNSNIRLYSKKSYAATRLSMMTKTPLQGTAAKPYDKKKIVVFGAGGYLGSTIYGYLQRAASIYGTGISDVSSSPRAICATAVGSASLNTLLGRCFKLAFAGENFIRLTNMQEVESIKGRIKGYDAAIIGTVYQLETRPVTGGSYERTPNDKTLEFYLDDRSMVTQSIADDDMEIHLNIFQNTIDACKQAGIGHIVVIETPATLMTKPFAKIIDEAGINFTYIRSIGKLENTKMYTFEDGIQSDVNIEGFTLPSGYKMKGSGYEAWDWYESLGGVNVNKSENQILPREDLAAVVVQSLMSLDWGKSRYLNVSSNGFLTSSDIKKDGTTAVKKNLKSDREWCMNSDIIITKMNAVN